MRLNGESHLISMRYTNWRGETATRAISPRSVSFRETKFHPKPQWILTAWDHDRNAERDFALADCDFLSMTDQQRALSEDGAQEAWQ